jgi:hypothetical protein
MDEETNVLDMKAPGLMFLQYKTCTGFIEDEENGPKWCSRCSMRRNLHTDVSPDF